MLNTYTGLEYVISKGRLDLENNDILDTYYENENSRIDISIAIKSQIHSLVERGPIVLFGKIGEIEEILKKDIELDSNDIEKIIDIYMEKWKNNLEKRDIEFIVYLINKKIQKHLVRRIIDETPILKEENVNYIIDKGLIIKQEEFITKFARSSSINRLGMLLNQYKKIASIIFQEKCGNRIGILVLIVGNRLINNNKNEDLKILEQFCSYNGESLRACPLNDEYNEKEYGELNYGEIYSRFENFIIPF